MVLHVGGVIVVTLNLAKVGAESCNSIEYACESGINILCENRDVISLFF